MILLLFALIKCLLLSVLQQMFTNIALSKKLTPTFSQLVIYKVYIEQANLHYSSISFKNTY